MLSPGTVYPFRFLLFCALLFPVFIYWRLLALMEASKLGVTFSCVADRHALRWIRLVFWLTVL